MSQRGALQSVTSSDITKKTGPGTWARHLARMGLGNGKRERKQSQTFEGRDCFGDLGADR
jgi:hypothetical protein